MARLGRQIGEVRAGNSHVYGLGAVGHRLFPIVLAGACTRFRDGFLLHTLAVTDVYVSLCQAEQRGEINLLPAETEAHSWRQLGDGDWLRPDLHVVVGIGDEALHAGARSRH